MADPYTTKQGDTVDLVAWNLKKATKGFTEAILRANPGLATQGPIFPQGVSIVIPDWAPPTPVNTKRLWS